MKLSGLIAGVLSCAFILSVVSCGRSPEAPLSGLAHLPEDLNSATADVAGIYQDAWTEESASVTLQQPTGEQALTIRGMIPNVGNTGFQTTVTLRVDQANAGSRTLGPGDFQFSVAVPNGSGKHRITVAFDRTQQLPAGDGRMVGARLTFLGFEPASRTPLSRDIVHGGGLELMSGWGVIETYRGETFRWVENDAKIRFVAPQGQDAGLSLVAEPGPGIGGKPFLLKVLDESGRQVAAVPVEGRGTVKLFMPIEADRPAEFRLHVDGGGKPAKNDQRILNFRVFRIEALADARSPTRR